jgi:hypothetical protein
MRRYCEKCLDIIQDIGEPHIHPDPNATKPVRELPAPQPVTVPGSNPEIWLGA